MNLYRERLWAAPWLYLATALVIPASLLVFAPINMAAGIITAVLLYGVCVVWLIVGSPTIHVTADALTAGRARIERAFIGTATAYKSTEATMQRGQLLDARAWLMLRGSSPVVRVPILDESDPAPYWLISTRHPAELTRVLNDRAGDNLPPARSSL